MCSSIGCQTSTEEVVPPKKVVSSGCQTDPVAVPRLPAQTAVPARVQGIVIPSIQARAPGQPPANNSKSSNPFQVAYSQPLSVQPRAGKVIVARQLDFQTPTVTQGQPPSEVFTKQVYAANFNTQFPVNVAQTSGCNAAGYHSGTLNSTQVRATQSLTAAQNSLPASNRFIPNSSLLAAQMAGNHVVGSSVYSGDAIVGTQRNAANLSFHAAGNVPQQDRLHSTSLHQLLAHNTQLSTRYQNQLAGQQHRSNQATAQNFNFNLTLQNNQLLTQKWRLVAQNNLFSSNQLLTNTRSASFSCSPAPYVGTQQQSAQRQMTPTNVVQVSTDTPSGVQTSIQQYNNEVARQVPAARMQLFQHYKQPSAIPQGSMKTSNQVATPQRVEGESLQRQNAGLERPQGQMHTQPNYPSAAQNHTEKLPNNVSDLIARIRQPSKQNPSSNSYNNSQTTLADGDLDGRAHSHIHDQSLYGEVQLIYNELQKNLNESTSCNKAHSRLAQVPQLQTLQSTPHVSSVSEERPAHYVAVANQILSDNSNRVQTSKTVPEMPHSNTSIEDGMVKRTVRFSQETDSVSVWTNVSSEEMPAPKDNTNRDITIRQTTSNNQTHNSGSTGSLSTNIGVNSRKEEDTNSSSPLGSSASTQIGTSDENSTTQETNKDPYRVPPKTPSGALEEAVQKLLVLQSKIANSEDSSGKGCVSPNSTSELTDDISKANTEEDNIETDSLNTLPVIDQELTMENNDVSSTGNLDKVAETSPLCEKAVVADLDEAQRPTGGNLSLLKEPNNENVTEHSLNTESKEGVSGGVQDSGVSSDPNVVSSEPNADLNNEPESEDKEDASKDEADSSFHDIYVDLMSPVIPRMSVARRRHSLSHGDSSEDVVWDDSSTSSVDASLYVADNSEHNHNNDPGPSISECSEWESGITDSADPSADADSNKHENGTGVDISEKTVGSDQDRMASGDTGVEMQVTEDIQATSTAGDDNEQATFNTKNQELTLGLERVTTEPSNSSAPVANNQEEDTNCAIESERLDQDHDITPLSAKHTTEEMEVECNIQETSGSGFSTDVDNIDQAACNTMLQADEKNSTHANEKNLVEEDGEECSDTEGIIPNTRLKTETSSNGCMGASSKLNNKAQVEQHELCELTPMAIPKQDFVYLNSVFQVSPTTTDMNLTKKEFSPKLPPPKLSLPLEEKLEQSHGISSSLAKANIGEKNVPHILVDSNRKKDHTEEAALLPIPRLALRVVDASRVIVMWDLPPDSKVTEINCFEVYAFMVIADAHANRTGQWVRIGQMKALKLPMACTIRHVMLAKKAYYFSVRAVGHNGQAGPLGRPCGVTWS